MRRLLFVCLIFLVTGHTACRILLTRSSAVLLEPGGYELTYTMAWGLGMSQRFQLAQGDDVPVIFSSEWIDVWKRPYNSGLSIYRSSRDGVYYFGSGYRMFRFDPSARTLEGSCRPGDVPAYSLLGARLSETQSGAIRELLDPGAKHLFNYVEKSDASAGVPTSPPGSKYYADLKYLGKFGLLRSPGARGGGVAFSSADSSPEPRLSLNVHCG